MKTWAGMILGQEIKEHFKTESELEDPYWWRHVEIQYRFPVSLLNDP